MQKQIPASIQTLIDMVKERTADMEGLAEQFETCFTNTLDTTVKQMEDGTSYVITGDIPAMWLRDSTAQLRPYLIPAREDEEIAGLIEGLVRRQFQYIGIDPYANAFNETASGACWEHDDTQMNDWVWERKYEIDSLCYPIQLAWLLWKNTGRTAQFDENFCTGVKKILTVFRTEQHHEEASDYRFIRTNSYFTDTLSRDGLGALVRSGTGMTWSGFRPSDDACVYGYLVPSNMFAAVVLDYVKEIAQEILKDSGMAESAAALAEEIRCGIETYGVTQKEGFGTVYAYEVDGYGQFHLMDDANVPSLLSMSYLGYQGKDAAVADNTRKMILSEANPYYYEGRYAAGIGSPHTPPGYIWPIALAVQGLTAASREEKKNILLTLLQTDGGKGMMHESFCKDDPASYTREWFSWANAMFCELVLDYCGMEVKR